MKITTNLSISTRDLSSLDWNLKRKRLIFIIALGNISSFRDCDISIQ